jgi:hypothetical protein
LRVTTNNQQAIFEHQFWLQIMGDHGRFIFNALAPNETNDIKLAQQFIVRYDQLLEEARKQNTNLKEINYQALQVTAEFRNFKLELLRKMLLGSITFRLPPTFINHMLNELEEYMLILNALNAGKPVPLYNPLHYDLVWLSDSSGHAGSIAAGLDRVETALIRKSTEFEKHFNDLYLKATQMAGYMRTMLNDFPAFHKFHQDVDMETSLFLKFLQELEELEIKSEVLDIITPLMPDHMAREECYYLTKLAQLGVVPAPQCNPARPRV